MSFRSAHAVCTQSINNQINRVKWRAVALLLTCVRLPLKFSANIERRPPEGNQVNHHTLRCGDAKCARQQPEGVPTHLRRKQSFNTSDKAICSPSLCFSSLRKVTLSIGSFFSLNSPLPKALSLITNPNISVTRSIYLQCNTSHAHNPQV